MLLHHHQKQRQYHSLYYSILLIIMVEGAWQRKAQRIWQSECTDEPDMKRHSRDHEQQLIHQLLTANTTRRKIGQTGRRCQNRVLEISHYGGTERTAANHSLASNSAAALRVDISSSPPNHSSTVAVIGQFLVNQA